MSKRLKHVLIGLGSVVLICAGALGWFKHHIGVISEQEVPQEKHSTPAAPAASAWPRR